VGHAIFDTADVNIFLLGNNTLLISSDKYFETVFSSYRVLPGIALHLLLEHGDFLNIDISQGSVATRLRRGGIFKRYIIANLLLSLKVKEF